MAHAEPRSRGEGWAYLSAGSAALRETAVQAPRKTNGAWEGAERPINLVLGVTHDCLFRSGLPEGAKILSSMHSVYFTPHVSGNPPFTLLQVNEVPDLAHFSHLP